MKQTLFAIFGIFLMSFSCITGQDATDILKKSEEKFRGKKTAYTEFKIDIIRPKWSREMKMKSWAKGQDLSLILITEPAKDRGAAFLKRYKEVWNWIPSIERTVKLPPSMMTQSWMGTDFTNDDLVKESSILNDYTNSILGDSLINDSNCYKILLTPLPDAPVVWGKIIVFIDNVHYNQLRAEMYDEDGHLVNTIVSSDVKELGGQHLATKMEMIPADKSGQKTIMTIENILYDQDISDRFFTQQNMKRVK